MQIANAQVEGSTQDHKRWAIQAEENQDIQTASIHYARFLQDRKEDLKISYRLAELKLLLGDFNGAKALFQKVNTEAENKYPLAAFYQAECLRSLGDCESAKPLYEKFRKAYLGKKDDAKFRRLAKNAAEGCEINTKLEGIESEVYIESMGADINGIHIEGSPLFLSENELMYNSLKTGGKTIFDTEATDLPYRRFYLAKKKDRLWQHTSHATNIPTTAAVKDMSNGAFSPDGSRFYFTGCAPLLNGKMNCDLYRMNYSNGNWSTAERLPGTINSKAMETQPAVGLDEKGRETIYFVSDKEGGKGGKDLWYSTYDVKKKTYKAARNCGSKLNTVGDEVTPFIDPMTGKLFFSSTGHAGLGGLDVFYSVGQRSSWLPAEHLQNGVNTSKDELYYVRSPKGSSGVFASNRKEIKGQNFCCDDLFFFEEKSQRFFEVKGTVFDQTSDPNQTLDSVKVKLYRLDEKSGERFFLRTVHSDEEGEYQFQLELDQSYLIRTEKKGFLASEKKVIADSKRNPPSMVIDFLMERYTNRRIVIENIYYQFDRDVLTEAAKTTIDTTIFEILQQNPEIIVELGSHTDSKGSDRYNESLSQRRAESVVRYLRQKGIAKNRLKAKGYGETQPIEPNSFEDGRDNPKGRARNRRTEFRVIGELDEELEYLDN